MISKEVFRIIVVIKSRLELRKEVFHVLQRIYP